MLHHHLAAALAIALAVPAAPLAGQTWVELEPAQPGTGAAAYDAARGRVTFFGDQGGGTWAWQGQRWNRLQPLQSPPDRRDHAMAYDPVHRRVVLFGGNVNGVHTNDTWAFEGDTWVQVTTHTAPPPRSRHAMVLDQARGEIVLFGGMAATALGDQWRFDGRTWSPVNVSPRPNARADHGMAYDPVRQRVVLVNGSTYLTETWEWDGAAWRLADTTGPSTAIGPRLAFDPNLGQVIAAGGNYGSASTSFTEAWNGTRWSNLPSMPDLREDHALVTDPARREVLAIGGRWSSVGPWNNRPYADTLRWDGATWSTLGATPRPRNGYAVAYDARRGQLVFFGGATTGSRFQTPDETWAWDDGWTEVHPGGTPITIEVDHRMVYDARRDRVVLFGGWYSSLWLNAGGIAEWNGASWTYPTALGPSSPAGHSMAYDAARGRTVVFRNGVTSEWDGLAWSTGPAGPIATTGTAMAYDTARQRIVLFGGRAQGSPSNQLWEYDGTAWRQTNPAGGPTPRDDAAFCYDPVRGHCVLVGGQDANATALADTWFWDGIGWTAGPTHPYPVDDGQLVFDTRRLACLLISRYAPRVTLLGTPAQATSMAACPASPTPRLFALGRPRLGAPSFGADVTTPQPSAPYALLFASRPATAPLGPCQLLIDPTRIGGIVAGVTDGIGFGTQRLAIALAPANAGLSVYVQGVALLPNAANVVPTDRIDLTLGF